MIIRNLHEELAFFPLLQPMSIFFVSELLCHGFVVLIFYFCPCHLWVLIPKITFHPIDVRYALLPLLSPLFLLNPEVRRDNSLIPPRCASCRPYRMVLLSDLLNSITNFPFLYSMRLYSSNISIMCLGPSSKAYLLYLCFGSETNSYVRSKECTVPQSKNLY